MWSHAPSCRAEGRGRGAAQDRAGPRGRLPVPSVRRPGPLQSSDRATGGPAASSPSPAGQLHREFQGCSGRSFRRGRRQGSAVRGRREHHPCQGGAPGPGTFSRRLVPGGPVRPRAYAPGARRRHRAVAGLLGAGAGQGAPALHQPRELGVDHLRGARRLRRDPRRSRCLPSGAPAGFPPAPAPPRAGPCWPGPAPGLSSGPARPPRPGPAVPAAAGRGADGSGRPGRGRRRAVRNPPAPAGAALGRCPGRCAAPPRRPPAPRPLAAASARRPRSC